jgi:hypothetical protein
MIPIRYGSFALSYEKIHVPGRWLAELIAEKDLDEHVVTIAPGQSRVFVRPSTVAPAAAADVEMPASLV